MGIHLVRWLAISTAAAALAFVASPVRAQPAPAPSDPPSLADSLTGDAKADYQRARGLLADGDFAAALVKFQSALETSKDNRLFWNLAACERGLRHYAQAIRYLERYRVEGGPLVTAKDRADADGLITALRPYVGAVTVHASETGATVMLDDKPFGTTPVEKTLVDLGEHRLVVRKAGFVDVTRAVSITGNADVVLDITLATAAHEGRIAINAASGDVIALDGKNVALGTYEGTVASGLHLVRVSAPSKKPYEGRILVEDGQLRSLDVSLEPEVQKPVPLWVWIGVGAVVVASVSAATYFATRSADEPPGPVPGTMSPFIVTAGYSSFRFGP